MASVQTPTNYGSLDAKGNVSWDEKQLAENAARTRKVLMFVCIVCCVIVGEGYDIGVLNGAIVLIQDDFRVTDFQMSLIVAVTPGFVLVGCPVGGHLADLLGRRAVLDMCCGLLLLGPLLMAAAQGITLLIIGRALVGFGIGIGFVVVSMLLTETVPADTRGWAVSLEEVFLNAGILMGYVANWLLLGVKDDWRFMLALGAILPVLLSCIMAFTNLVPESPKWLLQHGRREEAMEVMRQYLPESEMSQALEHWTGEEKSFVTWKDLCTLQKTAERKMLIAGIVVATSQTLCGMVFVVYYSSSLLKQSMGELAAFRGTACMGLARLLVVFLVIYALRWLGRRQLFLASATLVCFSCLWIAFAFLHDWPDWLKCSGFIFFMFAYGLGLGPVCFVYCTEVFPTHLRSKAFSLAMFLSRIVGTVSTVAMPLLAARASIPISFFVQAGCNVLVVALIWMYVAETKDKDPETMEKVFL